MAGTLFNSDVLVLFAWSITTLISNYGLLRTTAHPRIAVKEQHSLATALSVSGVLAYIVAISIVLANDTVDRLVSPSLALAVAVVHNILGALAPLLRHGPHVHLGSILLLAELLILYGLIIGELMGANYMKSMLFVIAFVGKGTDIYVYKEFIAGDLMYVPEGHQKVG